MPGVHKEIKSNIPDPHFRMRDTRLSGQKKFQPKGHGKFTLKQFHHEVSSDSSICPAGERLHCAASSRQQPSGSSGAWFTTSKKSGITDMRHDVPTSWCEYDELKRSSSLTV